VVRLAAPSDSSSSTTHFFFFFFFCIFFLDQRSTMASPLCIHNHGVEEAIVEEQCWTLKLQNVAMLWSTRKEMQAIMAVT
jgi:hypothetical protein